MPVSAAAGTIVGSAYADASFHGDAVADVAALTALGVSDRFDRQERTVESPLNQYVFDQQSAAASNPPDILVPDDSPATGRWIRLLPGGGVPGVHDLAGSEHAADSLADLNVKIIDALIDTFRLFYADQLDNPVNADWAVNALAPAVVDSNNNGLIVRAFDDITEEGVGFILRVPAGATNVILAFKSRAETAPGGAVGVVPRLYVREAPDAGAVEAWSAGVDLTTIAIPTTEQFQYDTQTITLASLAITAGNLVQFEITRNGAAGGDDLVGDWNLLELGVGFS